MITHFQGEHRFLSNFWLCDVVFEGLCYKSSEAAYQAAKTLNESQRRVFLTLGPGAAKRKGRELKIRPDWDAVKLQVMEQILQNKFAQNPELQEKLLQTAPQELIEGNHWGDTFWGVDDRKGGQNHLGRLLMKLRDELHDPVNDPAF